MGLRTGGRRAKSLKNRVKSSKIELRFREIRPEGCTSCTPVLQALIYFRCIFTALLRQSRFLLPAFPENWGARLRISGGCPARGEPEALIDLCSSIACRAQPCQRCTPVLQALIYFRCIFTALLWQSRFLYFKKNTPAPLGRGCSAVIGNVRWKRKASFAAGSWPGSRSPGPMRRCGRRSARCAQRAARRIPGG